MTILVTGCAGFIGYHWAKNLLDQGFEVFGVDNLNSYYNPVYKDLRLSNLKKYKNFNFSEIDLINVESTKKIIIKSQPITIYHLAAQAGVRLPLKNWHQYTLNNEIAFLNILNFIDHDVTKNFFYASSSSVYGKENKVMREDVNSLQPSSYYGLTKYSNELTAKIFSNGNPLKIRGLRFFSVYGPYGRPDMAYFRLFRSAYLNEAFNLNGNGLIRRDFTYIDDVINCIQKLSEQLKTNHEGFNDVVNIGGNRPVSVNTLINKVKEISGLSIEIKYANSDKLDLDITQASTEYLHKLIGYIPDTILESGLTYVNKWFKENLNTIQKDK